MAEGGWTQVSSCFSVTVPSNQTAGLQVIRWNEPYANTCIWESDWIRSATYDHEQVNVNML